MAQRIYIKVVGFSDEERHALNTVFRLSEQCRTMYQLWTPQAAEPARVALLDGQSWEARVEAESPLHRDLRLLWVGPNPPARIWRAFERPIQWPAIVESLDTLFSPNEGVDLPVVRPTESAMSDKQALIVSADRDERLYLRARLALARLTQADEADSGSRAVELCAARSTTSPWSTSSLSDIDAWALLRQLKGGRHPIRTSPSPRRRARCRSACAPGWAGRRCWSIRRMRSGWTPGSAGSSSVPPPEVQRLREARSSGSGSRCRRAAITPAHRAAKVRPREPIAVLIHSPGANSPTSGRRSLEAQRTPLQH